MPNRDVLVLCGGVGGEPAGTERLIELDVDAVPGSASKVNLLLEHITRATVEPLPGRLTDLLHIACYVFCPVSSRPGILPRCNVSGTRGAGTSASIPVIPTALIFDRWWPIGAFRSK
jgi:hypothetical protein